MKIKNIISVIILLLPTDFAVSQNQLAYGVIGSGVRKVSGTENILEFTSGKPIVGKVNGSTNISAIGFWNVYRQEMLTSVENEEPLHLYYKLEHNYPNPFNPSTIIRYTIPSVTLSAVEGSRVQLKVFDVLGNEVATLIDEYKPAGRYEVEFSVAQVSRPELASDVYFYQLKADSFVETKKMILLR